MCTYTYIYVYYSKITSDIERMTYTTYVAYRACDDWISNVNVHIHIYTYVPLCMDGATHALYIPISRSQSRSRSRRLFKG